MFDIIKKFFEFSSTNGLFLPAAYDSERKNASTSLFFAHITFWLATFSIIYLCIQDIKLGTTSAIFFAGMYFVFYMLHRLTGAKIDVKNESFDLEDKGDK